MRNAAVLAALLLGAASLSGCSQAPAPTKAEYVAVANQTCKAADTDLAVKRYEAKKDLADPGKGQRFARATIVKRLRDMVNSLNGIRPPDGDGGYLSSMYRDYAHALDLRYSDPLETDPATAKALTAAGRRLAAYGMGDCRQVGSASRPPSTTTAPPT